MTRQEFKIINEVIDAWENLKGGQYYYTDTINDWLIENMKPAMDKLRKMVGRKIPRK